MEKGKKMNKVCKTCGGFDICIMGHAGRTAECPEWRPKWIPVSERLPIEEDAIDGGFVLANTEEKVIIALWSDVCRFNEFVTHWMPLPEPPKEVVDIEQIEVE